MSDDEGTGRLIGRVKEHGSKVSILRLQPPDDGVAASDLDETLTINVERDRGQRLPPGPGYGLGDSLVNSPLRACWRISTAAEPYHPSMGKAMTIPSPSFGHPPN